MSKKLDLDKLTLRDLSEWAHKNGMCILVTLGKPLEIEEVATVVEEPAAECGDLLERAREAKPEKG
jgi:hypothetical protein